MTNEEKQLLLVDLCARLPYRVKIGLIGAHEKLFGNPFVLDIEDYKNCNPLIIINSNWLPYLRPMSNMTEEEKKEFNKLIGGENTNWQLFDENRIAHCKSFYSVFCYFSTMGKIISWCNEHHFDYRGLIPMGLALEAPEGMYKNK